MNIHFHKPRRFLLGALLLYVVLAQSLPSWGECYARRLYPAIGYLLSSFSKAIPFSVGDLFVALSLLWLAGILLHALLSPKKRLRQCLPGMAEYLLWLYAWFYLAWGLNYSQKDFYGRTGIRQASYSEAEFLEFADDYVECLNASYTECTSIDKEVVCREVVSGYRQIADGLGVHPPFHQHPRAKTMLFTPLNSMVGVLGSMAPFFCEFTLNGDLLPSQYPSTYAHELSHLLGIANEAEANFYAYQVCTRSAIPGIRFSGYLALLPHVLSNASRLLDAGAYERLARRVRPEVVSLYRQNREYWAAKYSPTIGSLQDWLYDLYLRGNKIKEGRKNYSQVIGLLVSYRQASGTSLSCRPPRHTPLPLPAP